MKLFTGALLYIAIIILFFQNILIPAAILGLWFSFRFGAGFLIPAAIMIDGYFGNFYTFPYLSLFSILWYILTVYLSPRVIDLNEA